MIAVDTNFLVYARRQEAVHHAQARRLLAELSEGLRPWAIPWPCVYEFLRVVTHPRIFKPPTRLGVALEELDRLFDSPALILLGDGQGHRAQFRQSIEAGRASGNIVHDAHIVALLREHGVRELWTTDKDFHRFPGIAIRNPFKDDEVHETRRKYRIRTPARRP